MSNDLISADSHVNPPPTMWAEYLPAAFRDQTSRAGPKMKPGRKRRPNGTHTRFPGAIEASISRGTS